MTIKRLILIVLTAVAIALLSLSLYHSWSQPQFQSRLELYQTNLVLQASEWRGDNLEGVDIGTARQTLLGEKPIENALKQYQEARQSAQANLEKAQLQLQSLALDVPTIEDALSSPEQLQLQQSVQQLENSIAEFDLRIGILQTQTNQTSAALEIWQQLAQRLETPNSRAIPETAVVLSGLWNEPPRLLPNAEEQLQRHLDGWFRATTLSRLYQLQQRTEALEQLQANQQVLAENAFYRLILANGVQSVGGLLGVGLLLFIAVQRLLKGKQSLWAKNQDHQWLVPWDWEIILQVLVGGFFFVGQILIGRLILPIAFALFQINPAAAGARAQAFYILVSYLLLTLGGLWVLYISVSPFWQGEEQAKSEDWFKVKWRENWIGWGLGGFFAALPLVVIVSLINQRLWQGQGGSNPILPIALEGQDPLALAFFFTTASLAAPIFEEIIFRGFLLPSLTRYLPMAGAILVSALVFAIAHQSLSEILPLTMLGMVLGFVYSRSRNLLAPILLHSLWNGSTLFSLFLLGGGG
ncbi:CPBP family intramembrane metalloprotease [Desertifilum sp. FACHB-1129]|uniref:Abortive phage infection protein n=1 Tax=Desertifilum tharense IPPAS B-1220 TaxID=1781255 RepID=A0A1E5QJ73_9CYAN|nr:MULTISPECIES: CPBP family glutamic-type intramembrane protease [Desertifilum]MDA0211336.1 CPBP family glutamic-type intramembrane protease [Cyanobacteria bacterium FC1]MBD2313971.1 CPBP family intramembrane metalloprotease [Desertifilum sp. FACHB-1129]MBD2320297.1 CPBP family intramembrane metalloprotease [Desertifilum sp. FACHB-866]MBD2330425.1 CPBP family intramembrane metalloprotease [Desertifilum sp. FACHB-868]OEJ74739.1 abortive phage infection protein [Desertifilum tharense IPPAS B-12